jgi:hypothetical protein
MNSPETKLEKIIIHYVGSKNNLDPLFLSQAEPEIDDETNELLRDNLLSRFKNNTE